MDASTTQQKIASLYIAFFERAPEQSGFNFWEGFAQSSGMAGLDLMKHIAEGFAMHPSFDETYGGLGNAAFVDAIYVNVGGSLPDDGGRAFWLEQLNNGLSRADFVAEYCYYVMELDAAELAAQGLTPAELADALARRATLYNQIEVSLAYVEAMGAGSNFAPGTDPMNPASLEQDPAYQAAVNILRGVDADPASNNDELAYLSGTPTVAEINQIFGPTPPPPGVGKSYILTEGQDILVGTGDNDTFFATGQTLQLGDSMDGKGGADTLSVSIQGHGVHLAGFAATDIEKIVVKSLSHDDSTLDLSDTTGVTLLASMETDGADLTFRDIQSVNKTAIKIVDTDEDHTFVYDLNAYDPAALDVVDLTVQEMRGHHGGPDITFLNRDWSRSNINQVNLHSLKRPDAGDSPATDNYIDELNVGRSFDVLNIDGDADLEIEDTLDERLRVINAGALDADLMLDVASETSVGTFIYTGALGDDNLDVMRDGNNDIALNTGNDDLDIDGDGNNTISGASGNDKVHIDGDGRHNIDLGSGNDTLRIDGDVDNYDTTVDGDGVTTIIAGTGNDSVRIYGDGDYNVDLGAGNDYFYKEGNSSHTIVAGEGNDTVIVNGGSGASNNVVDLGAGNDSLTITGNGTQQITGGGGNDTVTVNGNGNVTATGDADNDSITINGHGVHNVNLGEGNDYLLINGARKNPSVTDEDNSGGDVMTTVVGGGGNDTVDIRLDHYLNADLGAGDDRIILRARDLTSDDMVVGGAGKDTMQLSNASYDEQLIGQSETGSTTGFEVFDLRNANLTLRLTSDNFDTAEGKAITVYTQEADRTELPEDLVALGLAQGMSVTEFTAVAQAYFAGYGYSDAEARAELVGYLISYSGVKAVDFTDTTSDGDGTVYTSQPSPIYIESSPPFDDPKLSDSVDQVFFNLEPDGYMAVDITAVPLSLASGRTFTLLGGNIKDVVIADDDSINGRSTLNFDGPDSVNQSIEDTLYVVGQADIEAADLRKVDGLENIILSPDGTTPGVWEVVLTAPVVNQTTGTAPLSIFVDPDVPAGSELRITLDPTVMTNLNNDVYIYRNSNVQVYIDDVLVTEPQYGVVDFNGDGAYEVKVVSQNFFTTNADRLIGSEDVDDWFIARTLDDVQSGDAAWGYDPLNESDTGEDDDTVEFRFAPANITTSLQDQLENAAFIEIENFLFNTENNVRMLGIGAPWFAPDLELLHTGAGDDILAFMRTGLEYVLDGGDDWISLDDDEDGDRTTVWGGAGEDSLYAGDSNDTVYVDKVEYISLDGGEDEVNLMNPNPVEVTIRGAESIYGSSGADWVDADNDGADIYVDMLGGNDTLTVGNTPNNATVLGGTGNDSLTVYANNYARVWGDDSGGGGTDGNDTISVYVGSTSGSASSGDRADVWGEGGNDSINVVVGYGGVVSPPDMEANVDGGSGNDTISVRSDDDATVLGGTGNDSITVRTDYDGGENGYARVDGGANDDSITVSGSEDASVSGGTGNDVLDVRARSAATVDGGSGDDNILVRMTTGYAIITGGDGNDTISVVGSNGDHYITGGAGDDDITLDTNPVDARDILFFGTRTYNAVQQLLTDTQGLDNIKNFQFEAATAGDPAPTLQDGMDFSAFLNSPVDVDNIVVFPATWSNGTTVDANNGGGTNSVVFISTNGATLTAADFSTAVAGTIQLEDNGRAVIIVGMDQTGPGSGIGNFDVYYVQDVNTGAGQTWVVDQVADVAALTRVGIPAVLDNLLAGLVINTDGGDEDFPAAVGNQTYDLTGGGLNNDDTVFFASYNNSPRDSGQDTVLGFDTGSNPTDKLDFGDWYFSVTGIEGGGGNFSNGITVFTGSAGDTNIAGRMALYDAGAGNLGNVDSAAEIAALFNGASRFDIAVGGGGRGQALLMTGADNTATAYIWSIDDYNDNGSVEVGNGEVYLVAEVQLVGGTPDIQGFWDDNFPGL